MIHATEILSDFIYELSFADIGSETKEQAKLYIADYLAAVYGGYYINKNFNDKMLEIIKAMDGGSSSDVLIEGVRLSAEHAAFMNAVYAHGADIDDGNRVARGHIAAHVMSAVFAIAQTMDVTWKEVITAIIAGYEVFNRIGGAAQPGLVHRGFHSTGTAGAPACAAACAKLLRLDKRGIYNAISISAVQAGGLILIAESGQCCKPLNPANAARTGIISVRLAQKGIEGPVFPLESDKGWFHAMSGNVDESVITEGLGKTFTINQSYLKPYPSCRHTHCGIEAASKLKKRFDYEGISVSDIKNIEVYTYQDAIKIAGQIVLPESSEDAKFSVHYSLAVALEKGDYTIKDLIRPVTEKSRELVYKIKLIADESMEDTGSGIRGARVKVILDNGGEYEETVLLPKGDASNPLTWDDMENKMAMCMEGLKEEKQAHIVCENIRRLDMDEKFSSIADFVNKSIDCLILKDVFGKI